MLQRYFTDIFVYDIFSNIWYFVTATGELPPRRAEFCSGISSAPDDSSFQITMYGGYDLLSGDVYSDIYVLTLPAFHWIKVTATGDTNFLGRNRHDCNMFNDAQMIVTGGGTPNTDGLELCDTRSPPIKVLDTSNYVWMANFQPDLPSYSVPQVIRNVIGGSPSGGASVIAPMNRGWRNNTALKEVFAHTVPRDTYVYPNGSNTSPSEGGTPSPTKTSTPKSHTNTGAIVGGVIAGVVSLALIAGIPWYCVRRRRRLRQQQQPPAHSGLEKSELHGETLPAGTAHRASELGSMEPAQLATKTDHAELDGAHAAELAAAMQGVQSPVELEGEWDGRERREVDRGEVR